MNEENASVNARLVKGRTIAWADGQVFDFDNPESTTMTIEDYAFALAYTVRWRGQTRYRGRRCFYGVGQHCVIGAEEMLADGFGPAAALAFLTHESDEVPLPDMPGPVKDEFPQFRPLAKRCAAAIDRHLGFPAFADQDLVKRYDIRMLVTEKRDLLARHEASTFSVDGHHMADARYAPFARPIVPYEHPDIAALAWINLYDELRSAA